jgi:hypothetical protein
MKEYSKNPETGNALFKKDGNSRRPVVSRDIANSAINNSPAI